MEDLGRHNVSMQRLQSTLRLRDAELLHKDTELDEKRTLLNKTKVNTIPLGTRIVQSSFQSAIEELQDALTLSQDNEKQLETALQQAENNFQTRLSEVSDELGEAKESLERREKEKKLLEVDVLERDTELSWNKDRVSELESELSKLNDTLQTQIRNSRELTIAMKQREFDLNECLDKIAELEKAKEYLIVKNKRLETHVGETEKAEEATMRKLQTKIAQHQREIEESVRECERQLKTARIQWLEKQVEAEKRLKEEQANTLYQAERAFEVKLQEKQMAAAMYDAELKKARHEVQNRMGFMKMQIDSIDKQQEKINHAKTALSARIDEVEIQTRANYERRIEFERNSEQRNAQLKQQVLYLQKEKHQLTKKLQKLKHFLKQRKALTEPTTRWNAPPVQVSPIHKAELNDSVCFFRGKATFITRISRRVIEAVVKGIRRVIILKRRKQYPFFSYGFCPVVM